MPAPMFAADNAPVKMVHRKRRPEAGPFRGRPLEEGSRPMINGLYAHQGGDQRVSTPPQKENRQTDDIFVAQAELRALEALNSKLTAELCAIEERTQQMELDRNSALAEADTLRERERQLREQVANARRDAGKASADAEKCEEDARRAAADSEAQARAARDAAEGERRERTARQLDVRQIESLTETLAKTQAALASERDRRGALEGERERLRGDLETATAEVGRLREEEERLREDVETEKEWREQAQREGDEARDRLDAAEAAARQAKESAAYLRRTSKLARDRAGKG